MVRTEPVSTCAGSVETHAAEGLGDGFADCIVWKTGEFLRGLIIQHGLVELWLGLGSAQLCAAASLAQCFDGFAGERLVADGLCI